MKTLILINGPNGVGKSTTCACLHQYLPHSSWLDSEWCRMINPFGFTPEIELLTERHISLLLRGYLECSLVEYVIFSWGFHGPRKRIFNRVLHHLQDLTFQLLPITLVCSEEENIRRMEQDGREDERIQGGLQTRPLYESQANKTIDTTLLTVEETVKEILAILRDDQRQA